MLGLQGSALPSGGADVLRVRVCLHVPIKAECMACLMRHARLRVCVRPCVSSQVWGVRAL